MTHVRRNSLFGTVLVVTLAALFSAGSEALDRPIVDTRKSETCSFIEREVLNNLPTSGRTFEAIAQIVPGQVTVENQFSSSGKLTGSTFRTDRFVLDFSKVQINKIDCSYKGEKKGVDLGSGYSATVQYTRHTQPEDRAYLRAFNLRLNGGRVGGEQLWFFKPTGSQVAEQPPPESIPVIPPVPGPPVTPTEPSGFLGSYDIRLNNGTLFDVAMKVRPHPDHKGHVVIVDSREDYLCLKAEGLSQIRISDAMRDSFNFQRTLPPRANLIWQDGRCTANADRSVNCNLEGTFHSIPVRSSWTARAVQGSTNIEGEGSLEIRGDILRYDLSGRWGPRF